MGERKRGKKQRDFARKNAIHFLSKLIIFQKVESDVGENSGRPRSDEYHELNVSIVKSYFDPNNFNSISFEAEGKQISLKRVTLHIILTSKLIFYHTVLGIAIIQNDRF